MTKLLPCSVPGCPRRRGPDKLTCYHCWKLVPRQLMVRIYRAWNNGTPTDDYEAARRDVLDAITEKRKAG